MAGKIKKLLESELVGGTQTTDVYPVTSTKAVYDENNERLDNIINKIELGIIYDVSANNDGAVFESLSALLSSSNLSTLIPTSVRHGGMSIRFVQSSDNMYVQYRYTSDDAETVATFTNTDNWSFCGEEVLIDNPEFIEAKTDSEGKLLEARRVDSTKVEYYDLQVKGRIINEGFSQEISQIDAVVEDMQSQIGDNFENIDNIVNNPNNLTPHGYLSEAENPEWLSVITDKDGRILEGITKEGKKMVMVEMGGETIDDLQTRVTALEDILVNTKENSFASIGIDKFAVSGTSSKTEKTIILDGGGDTNKAYLNEPFECAYKQVSCVFITSNTPNITIGVGPLNKVYLRNDNSNGKVSVLDGANVIEEEVIGFELEPDEKYLLNVSFDDTKDGDDVSVEITGEYGERYSQVFNINYDLPFNGAIYIASESVTTIANLFVTNQHKYDIKNAKAAIFGHSFVEAWSLSPLGERDKSFANLLVNSIGKDVCMVYGLGGDTVGGMYDNIVSCKEMVRNIQYCLLCIGVNDSGESLSTYIVKLNQSIGLLKSLGIIPILFTIQPSNTGYLTPVFEEINSWIKSSEYTYVDMDKVFYNVDGTINTHLYLQDGIHPNVEGHKRIFDRIKMDCPFLF